MLVITRNLGESFRIGDDVVITVTKVRDESVRLGIDAPLDIDVNREKFTKKAIIIRKLWQE